MKTKKRIFWSVGAAVLLLALVYFSPSLWLGILLSRLQGDLSQFRWGGVTPGLSGQVSQIRRDDSLQEMAAWTLWDVPGQRQSIQARVRNDDFKMVFADPFRFHVGNGAVFLVKAPSFDESRKAWDELFSRPVIPPWYYRWAAAFWLRPRWDGVEEAANGKRYPRVRIPDGHIWGTPGGRLGGAEWEGRIGKQRWRVELASVHEEPASIEVEPGSGNGLEQDVCSEEMDRSLAEALRLLGLMTQPVPVEPDGEFVEGDGRLIVRDGTRILQISGAPYEMGRQQGVLLADSVRRGLDRIVYGVGLAYSVTRGEWFFDVVRDVVEIQKPYVEERFMEEMKGLADGAGVPLEEVIIANFFPELWHCSGAALFGEATADGKMLHARVLDYIMVGGLQDEAVLIAARPEGYADFVNIGYSGFVGSVTGMNEHGIAIGEMGGRGYGDWDGTPMSLLMRGALEECTTLEDALAYFQDRPRTCEYYYVFSDGPARNAAAVRATPGQMDIIFPGETHPRFPDPVPDTALISGGSRYRHLVRRIREQYGSIDVKTLIEILRRPVSMESNLHNVIFEVEDRIVHVAHAGRFEPACDRPYIRHTWEDLFPNADE